MVKRFTAIDVMENQDQIQSEQQEEQPDAIQLLAQELRQIREALGLGDSPNSGAILHRLTEIENRIGEDPREANLPKIISRSQVASRQFLLRNKIRLEDIATGKVRVDMNLE